MYRLTKDDKGNQTDVLVKRISDGAFIPKNPDNRDWVAYQEWLDAGNTPQDPE